MVRTSYAIGDAITVEDLAERWILSEQAAGRLVRAAGLRSIAADEPGAGNDGASVRFRLDAIRRWESNHQIVFRTLAAEWHHVH